MENKSTKLVINLRDGIIDVEGEQNFVQSIYDDFKEQITKAVKAKPSPPKQLEHHADDGQLDDNDDTPQHKDKTRKPTSGAKNGKAKSGDYKPTFKSDLDLTALREFYNQYAPSNHPEKILIFATFLRDHLKLEPCTADDIFTCYFTVKDRTETPRAFLQAFRDTHNKTHYIDFVSTQSIRVTIPGNNHFNQTLKKKEKGSAE